MVFKSNSSEETQRFAYDIAQRFIKKGSIIALNGELGAGKTTFVQGFARGLGISDKIISPTFVLIRQHQIPNLERTLYHIDLYRLEGNIDPQEFGLNDMLSNGNTVLIEWAEKIKKNLPKNTIWIKIEKTSETCRTITVG